MTFTPAHLLLIAVVLLSILLMLLRPRGIAEVWWIGSGAALLVVLRLIPLRLAGHAIAEGTDVYLFLAGMMLLSELARCYGVFDWLASVAVEHARGSCARLFTLVYAVGIVVTVLLSNDATAVVLTPAVLAALRRSRAEPLPHLFACAMIANAASFVLPISNPANLVVYRAHMPPLGRWMAAFGLPSVLSIAVTWLVLRWCFRRSLGCAIPGHHQHPRFTPAGKFVLAGIFLTAGVLIAASALGRDLGLPTLVSALVIAAVAVVATRTNPLRIARHIAWSVLPLVAGLFVLVEAMEQAGAMQLAARLLVGAVQFPAGAGAFLAAAVVGVGNNLVNNLPLGLIAGNTLRLMNAPALMAHAVLIAVDLGPNLSVTGSLATILWLIALRREGVHVGFLSFFKVGAVVMPLALAAAIAGAVILR